jgi:hypothetical protein
MSLHFSHAAGDWYGRLFHPVKLLRLLASSNSSLFNHLRRPSLCRFSLVIRYTENMAFDWGKVLSGPQPAATAAEQGTPAPEPPRFQTSRPQVPSFQDLEI